MTNDDWTTQLKQLHENDKAKHQAVAEAEAKKKQQEQDKKNHISELLRHSRAYELMREVQKLLLNGKGVLDVFEASNDYERTITLAWQGPISDARRPNPEDPDDCYYIQVGVRHGRLWVNDKPLSPPTPNALKIALLKAAKNPERQKINQS